MATPAPGLRICLAASGGGHVRQLLDLAPVWTQHDHFFVTEDTALGRSIARSHRTHFVDHVALGQARLGRAGAMLGSAARNFAQSITAIARERPDIVLSTGAGAVFFACLAARLMGAQFILIDSFARFQAPSAFARIARPLAHRLIVQSPTLQARWPAALVFDPLKRLAGPVPAKEDLIFVTVGATLGFDRLIESVAALKRCGDIPERVIFQIGAGRQPDALPEDCEVVTDLDFAEVQALLQRARIVITHGGTGSLVTALRAGCNVIAMPRLFARGEHYDDHQREIIQAFVARGLILAAEDVGALAAALPIARTRPPTPATTDPSALQAYLTEEIARLHQ